MDVTESMDERAVPAPEPARAWVEPGPNDAGGWEDDQMNVEWLRANGRVVLEPGDDGRIEGVVGYVHRAEYMQLVWLVQSLKTVVGAMADTGRLLGEQANADLELLDRIQPIRTNEDT